ncbi:hypothetical protein P5V15_002582 [Pogonomyrmex californicus]
MIQKLKRNISLRAYLMYKEKEIDVEFELLFPYIDKDILLISYPDYINHILSIYNTEKTDKDLLVWDRVTNSYIALTQLVPPTARGKNSAAREKNATPLHIDENKTQPKLIAVGPNKLAIDQYFLKIDKHLILLPTKDIIKAIDYLFKAHYVFHTEYNGDLKNFWTLIQHYFYKISSNCSNKVIEY